MVIQYGRELGAVQDRAVRAADIRHAETGVTCGQTRRVRLIRY